MSPFGTDRRILNVRETVAIGWKADQARCVYRKLDSAILVVKATEDRV